jgi:hypothetical protein
MFREIVLLISVILLAGCAGLAPQEVPLTSEPTAIVTEPPVATATDVLPSPTAAEPEATLEPSPAIEQPTDTPEPSPAPETGPLLIAYTGADGNLWLVDPATGEQEQLTQDAASPVADSPDDTIQYCCTQWTTDRGLLSYRRDVGTPVPDGLDYHFGLWVYDLARQEHRQILEDQVVAGFTWKPLTHLLVYGLPVDEGYFAGLGEVSAGLARGIWAVDVDQGEPFVLVPPQGGYSLVNPEWSRDGRFLSFEEVLYFEGRGNFAYFDFEAQEYVSWERPVGNYDWSSDGLQILYDDLTYIPTGTERIYMSDRMGEGERAISPPVEPGYAFNPVFSPDGNQVAYLAELGGPESWQYNLFVLPLAEGEPQNLGVFEQVNDLAWLPDSSGLVFASGSWGNQQVLLVEVPGAEVTTLADGYQPSLPQLVP